MRYRVEQPVHITNSQNPFHSFPIPISFTSPSFRNTTKWYATSSGIYGRGGASPPGGGSTWKQNLGGEPPSLPSPGKSGEMSGLKEKIWNQEVGGGSTWRNPIWTTGHKVGLSHAGKIGETKSEVTEHPYSTEKECWWCTISHSSFSPVTTSNNLDDHTLNSILNEKQRVHRHVGQQNSNTNSLETANNPPNILAKAFRLWNRSYFKFVQRFLLYETLLVLNFNHARKNPDLASVRSCRDDVSHSLWIQLRNPLPCWAVMLF